MMVILGRWNEDVSCLSSVIHYAKKSLFSLVVVVDGWDTR
jgi:hypothetical protein